MGETDDREQPDSAVGDWAALLDFAERMREHGFAVMVLLGRVNIPVVCGRQPPYPGRYQVLDDLLPGHIPAQPDDPVSALAVVFASTDGPVRWVGTHAPTTLAHLMAADPESTGRLVITQTGGSIHHDPNDSFQSDPAAARTVIATATDLRLLTCAVTSDAANTLRPGDDIDTCLIAAHAPAWTGVLRQHLEHWNDTG